MEAQCQSRMFDTTPELEMFLHDDNLSFSTAFPSAVHSHNTRQTTDSKIAANDRTPSVNLASVWTHKVESSGSESQNADVTLEVEDGAGWRKSTTEKTEVAASPEREVSSCNLLNLPKTSDSVGSGSVLFCRNSPDLDIDKRGKNNPPHNKDYERNFSAKPLQNQTVNYKCKVVKSEPASDDEYLPVTFMGLYSHRSSRDVAQRMQQFTKPVAEHTANTELKDTSLSFHIDLQDSSVEERGALNRLVVKQESDTEVAVETEQKSESGLACGQSEEDGNGEAAQRLLSSGYARSSIRLSRTAKKGWEVCSQEKATGAAVLPTGLYQNVHVVNRGRTATQQKPLPPKAALSIKKTSKRKRQIKTRLSKSALTVRRVKRCKALAAGVGSSSSKEPSGTLEDVLEKSDGPETTSLSHPRGRSKRKAKGGSERDLPQLKRKREDESAKVHQCPICSSTFTCAASQRIHMRLHTGEKPYVCEDCDMAFSDNSALRRHKRIHSGSKPYTCRECGESFARSFTLTVHLRRHSGEKPYQCQHCGMSFSQSANLKKHIRIHTGDKPYRCDLCPAAFAQGHALKSHYTIHKDEKPYMCQECGDIFSRPQYLQKHMKTHDHTKSYLCQYCPATFRTHESLRYHTESHLGDKTYQCEECMMTFHRKDHYKVHKFRTHRNVKYSCDVCEAVYNRSDHLKRHKTKAHPCGV